MLCEGIERGAQTERTFFLRSGWSIKDGGGAASNRTKQNGKGPPVRVVVGQVMAMAGSQSLRMQLSLSQRTWP